MELFRMLAVGYFLVALYGVLRSETLPLVDLLSRASLLIAIVLVLLGWKIIFPAEGRLLSEETHETKY